MAIERKLSKTQVRVFAALTQQRGEIQEILREIGATWAEQIEMLREKYDLPEGEYQIRQEKGGDVVLFMVEKLVETEPSEEEGVATEDADT